MSAINLHSVITLIWVPLYLFLATYYLIFHFRDRLRSHLLFAFLWFCWAIYGLGAAGLYASHSPGEGGGWQRLQFLGAIFAYPTIFLFMVQQSGLRWRTWLAWTLYGCSALFALAALTSTAFVTDIPAVREFDIFGHLVRYPEREIGWLGTFCLLWGLILLAASCAVTVVAIRRKVRGARALMVGIWAIVACSLNDSLVGLAVFDSLYLVEHGFVIFAFTAAYFMQDQTLTAEHELWKKTQLLLEANRDLNGLDRLKEQLLANISHELRTPLVSIRGYSEFIRDGKMGPVTAEQKEGLTTCLGNVERLLVLINNLLDYAKLRDGRVVLESRAINLTPVVEEATAAAEPMMAERGVILERGYSASEEMWVFGDSNKLRQVLDNLLSNAIKASRDGLAVRVEMGVEEAAVWVAVEDAGQGIPEDRLERIFDRFYQLEQSRECRHRGTGIGLAVVRDLVKMHNGELRVTSQPGQGARFEIWLPSATPESVRLARPLLRAVAATVEEGPPLILVADDDRDISQFLGMAFEREGYRVEVARNGEKALELASSGRFNAMLLDINMGGMSGLEVLAELRGTEGPAADLPVVMITATRSDEVRRQCEELGCDRFLLKPFAMKELSATLKELL